MSQEAVSPSRAEPTGRLASRTYIGLLAAQFLAAFNDQAIHAAGMFYAINTRTLSESQAISLMPILFYAPWAIFCTIAGYFADRYSKRQSLVFWKFAEILIAGLALVGFYIGNDGGKPHVGAWVVLGTVFLMGMHSAFFVPAKYGVMPEILAPRLLSRGNGLLESLSFLAVILGTVSGGVLSFLYLREETTIGWILLGLAVVGALASLLIRKMPAANPTRSFPSYIYGPLYRNLKTLVTSKPLSFTVIGLVFFTFVVAFMRAAVYMLGESQNPRWDELRTSAVVGTVALGIGLGAPLAGYLSGRKLELGLIPLGGLGMVIGTVLAASFLDTIPVLISCIILIGFCTGFYLVPLFTLLQYRSPKSSKGDMVATSNFINVLGAIMASLVFAGVVSLAKRIDLVPTITSQTPFADGELVEIRLEHGRPTLFRVETADGQTIRGGRKPAKELAAAHFDLIGQLLNGSARAGEKAVLIDLARGVEPRHGSEPGSSVSVSRYELRGVEHFDIHPQGTPTPPAYDEQELPKFLFLGIGLITMSVLAALWIKLPDLPRRAIRFVRGLSGRRVIVDRLDQVPDRGALLVQVASNDFAEVKQVARLIDRYTIPLSPAGDIEGALKHLRAGHAVAVSAGGMVGKELAATGSWAMVTAEVLSEGSDRVIRFGVGES